MQGHKDGSGLIDSVVVLEGGTAGWMTAPYLKQVLPSLHITLAEAIPKQYLMHLNCAQGMARSRRRPIRMDKGSAEGKAYARER